MGLEGPGRCGQLEVGKPLGATRLKKKRSPVPTGWQRKLEPAARRPGRGGGGRGRGAGGAQAPGNPIRAVYVWQLLSP
jgi:hypothetical protein